MDVQLTLVLCGTKYIPMTHTRSSEAIVALAATLREEANALIVEELAIQRVTDILPAHGAVLHALFRQNPIPMGALAESIHRKKNTVTSLIKTLEERGYCRKQADLADGRVQLIFLTPKGESMRDILQAVSGTLLGRAWAGIPEADRDACASVLQRVIANLRNRE